MTSSCGNALSLLSGTRQRVAWLAVACCPGLGICLSAEWLHRPGSPRAADGLPGSPCQHLACSLPRCDHNRCTVASACGLDSVSQMTDSAECLCWSPSVSCSAQCPHSCRFSLAVYSLPSLSVLCPFSHRSSVTHLLCRRLLPFCCSPFCCFVRLLERNLYHVFSFYL